MALSGNNKNILLKGLLVFYASLTTTHVLKGLCISDAAILLVSNKDRLPLKKCK